MRDLIYPVRYFDAYGRPLATVNISIPAQDDGQLHQVVAEAGDKALPNQWATAHVQGMKLVVENPTVIQARKDQRSQSQVVQALKKIAEDKEAGK